MTPTRQLPENIGAERSVLGALLLSTAALDDLAGILKPEDFSDVGNASIWEAVAELHRLRHPVDLMTLSAKMRALGTMARLSARGDESYLVELQIEAMNAGQNMPLGVISAEQTLAHGQLVQDTSRRRAMILLSARIVDLAYSGTLDSGQLVEQFQTGLGQLAERGHARVPRPFRELLHENIKRIEQRYSDPNKKATNGIPTGLDALDELTQGYQPGEAFIVAARPAMGKTSFVFGSVFHAAALGYPVLVFSLEMSEDEATTRALSSQAGVNSRNIKTGMLTMVDWMKITKATTRLAPLSVHLDGDGAQSVETICSKARKWRRDPKVFASGDEMALLVVDYLQLIPASKGRRAANRDQEVTEVMRQLRALAKELKVTLLLVGSLSRKCEDRQDKRPIPSDLRDSGNIESDADTVLMIYRDEVYNAETEDKGVAELIVRKARNGTVGVARVKWTPETTTFSDL